MGVDIAKAAIAAGHQVIATSRNPEKVQQALDDHENLLVVKLDITNMADAEAAVKTGTEKFGKIDVLINNAANFNAGYFEELSMEEIEGQLATSYSAR